MPNSLSTKKNLEAQLSELELEKLKREKLKRGLGEKQIWRPNPGPQTTAYQTQADETFFGGAGGGGKTDLILGVAGTIQHHSIIFRRLFPLTRAIIERSREIYNTENSDHQKDSYNESLHLWRLADGRVVEFGSIQYEKDKENYRGRPHDFYGFDEITEFTESQYRFVIGWNRSTRPGQRCRVIATGNPPSNEEGQWVIKYWGPWLDPHHPNPARPGELRWFATVAGEDYECAGPDPVEIEGETIHPRSRTFIPARLSDNPYLADTGYLSVLQSMPEPYRSQMLYGDFNISFVDDPWQVIPTAWVRKAQERWLNLQADIDRNGGELPQQTALGVDVARGGKDFTVIVERRRNWFGEPQKLPGKDTPESDPVVREIINRRKNTCQMINIDLIGPGGAVYDTGRKMGLPGIQGINVATRSDATDKSGKLTFVNLRAELYWKLREALDPESGDDIMLPPHKEVLPDLCSAKWMMRTGGIQVEAKEDIKKRIARSPDVGDAILLAHHMGQRSRQFQAVIGGQRPVVQTYVPR
jgi:hypothetical protein